MVRAVPDGFHTLTPHLVVKDAEVAIAFYEKAFGARELCRLSGPGGRGTIHAEIKIGDSIVFLVDEFPEMGSMRSPEALGSSCVSLHLYVEDCDALYQQAVSAGSTPKMPPTDMFWGDRYGMIEDPFGHVWTVATHLEDLTPEQMRRRTVEAFGAQA